MAVNKILLVDDSATDLQNLKDAVAGTGIQFVTASSGEEAITVAAKETPDLIFMDIVMDDVDGYRACRTLKDNDATKDIPVVFVSSKKQRADKLWAEKQGGRGFVVKPYSKDEILDQIKVFQ